MKNTAAILLLAAGAVHAQESLEVTGGLQGMVDAYLTGIARGQLEGRKMRVAQLRTPSEIAARQVYIRQKMLEEIGGFPEKTPLDPRLTGTLERDGYRIEKVIFESQPRYYVTANVYVPAGGRAPYAAVLGTAGHSAGGKAHEVYQRGWIGLVKRGFLVLAYDPPGQGERSEYWDAAAGRSRVGIGTSEHTMTGLQCLLTGTTMARYEIWDGIRAFDYLLTRKDVDPKRIAVVGNSGGGTQSAYLAAFEPRLAVAAPSCYMTSWETLWAGPGPQDAEQVFPGFLRDGLDFGDFLIPFAPKPAMMLTAIRDFFPIAGARATFAEVKRIYEGLDQGAHAGFFEYDDPHGWSKPRREATYRWLERWLHGREVDGAEPEFATEPEPVLNCTRSGQVVPELGGETAQSLNRALAERLERKRPAAGIAERIALAVERGAPKAERRGEVARAGYRIEKRALEPEPGITVPALAFVPAAGAERKPAVLYVNAAGKAADAAPGGDLEALARAGRIVLAIDPRGWGEGAAPARRGGYSASYQTAMRALLVGKTMAGMQVADILRAFDYLAARPDVDAARISILGKGNGGVLALYAAALEPRIERVACERAVLSYMDIVRAPQHAGIIDIVVPGVLKHFDLPDVAASIAPRAVWVVSPATPTGAPAAPEQARAQYGAGVRVVERPEGAPLETIYGEWLR